MSKLNFSAKIASGDDFIKQVIEMTEQERINFEMQKQLAIQDAKFDKAMLKIDMALEELRQQREDMRRLWERQDEERRKHDADMKAAQVKHDADIKALDARFDEINKQINDTWRQTMLGIGGMIVALGALLFAALK